jgi:SAM-dependent methyltransferase
MTANEGMIEFWNGPGGDRWVTLQERYDAELDPVSVPLVEQMATEPECRVLDVGCGNGSMSLSIARSRTGQGHVTGVDISSPMLDLARHRAERDGIERVTFVRADAQSHTFEAESFDVVVSRFGVMFFDDPVAAFTNLRRSVVGGGRLRCLVWQSPDENEWVRVPSQIASTIVDLPPHGEGPGPFGLADPDQVRRILVDAGWSVDEIDPVRGDFAVGGPLAYEDAIEFVIGGGPLARGIADAGESAIAKVAEALTDGLSAYYDGAELRMGYAAWLVEATRP